MTVAFAVTDSTQLNRYSISGHWSYSCSSLWPNCYLCFWICAALVDWLWLGCTPLFVGADLNKATVFESWPEETHRALWAFLKLSCVCALVWISRWAAFLSSQKNSHQNAKSHLKIIHSLDGCIWARSEEENTDLESNLPQNQDNILSC